MPFLAAEEIHALGLAAVGDDVQIDRDARLLGAPRISIGSHVRIDAFAVLSAGQDGIVIGDHVHVASHCFVAGAARIELADFCGISGRVSIYSSTDDFSGHSLTGPTVPDAFRSVDSRPVRVGRHVIVGAGTVVLPGATIGDGAAIGALSLVRVDVPAETIAVGVPVRVVGTRASHLLELESRLGQEPGEA